MLKYTVLRLGIFAVVLGALWLVGMRSPDQFFLLLLLAALISMGISFFALKGPRDQLSEQIDARVNRALARHKATGAEDDVAEDREVEQTSAAAPPAARAGDDTGEPRRDATP